MIFGSQRKQELRKMAEILAERTDSDLLTVQRNVSDIANLISQEQNLDFETVEVSVYRKLLAEVKADY